MNLFRFKNGNSTNHTSNKRALVLILLVLSCFAFSQLAEAAQTSNVNVVNTPNVNVANTPTVTLSGTPTVSLSGTPSVNVANTSTSPVPVQDVRTATSQPFFHHNFFTFSTQFGNDSADAYTVPAGKRLVIEYVSASGKAGHGEVFISWAIHLGPTVHYLTPILAGSGNDGFDYFSASAPVRGYLDAGSQLFFDVERCQFCTTANASASYTVSGYLVDAP